MFLDDVLQVSQPHGSTLPPQYLSAAEEHQCGYRLDAVGIGEFGILVHINLDDADAASQFGFQLFQDWVHSLTRTTPGGKEVNQSKLAGIDGFELLACVQYGFISSAQAIRLRR